MARREIEKVVENWKFWILFFATRGRTFENFEGWKFLVGPNLVESHEFRWPEVLNLEFGFGIAIPTYLATEIQILLYTFLP